MKSDFIRQYTQTESILLIWNSHLDSLTPTSILPIHYAYIKH